MADKPKRIKLTPPPEALAPGDWVEFKVTYEVEDAGAKVWVGYGMTSAVREGEDTEAADQRVHDHVYKRLREEVQAAIDNL